MQSETKIIDNCIALLEQVGDLLERIDDDIYSGTMPLSPHGSIGKHLRHVLDFYQNFIRGIESRRIDYNLRTRDTMVERHRLEARKIVRQTIGRLRALPTGGQQPDLLVKTEDALGGSAAWCSSSVRRELEFLKSHTIHHFSLIAMLLRLQDIEPGEEFGVAPSTLKYWKEEARCAR